MNKANKIYIDRAYVNWYIHNMLFEEIGSMKKGKDLSRLYRELQMNNFIKEFMSNNPGLMMQVNASKGSNIPKLTIKMLDSWLDELNNS